MNQKDQIEKSVVYMEEVTKENILNKAEEMFNKTLLNKQVSKPKKLTLMLYEDSKGKYLLIRSVNDYKKGSITSEENKDLYESLNKKKTEHIKSKNLKELTQLIELTKPEVVTRINLIGVIEIKKYIT